MNADEKANLADALLRLEMASRSKLRQLNHLIAEQDSKVEDQESVLENGSTFRVQKMTPQGFRSVGTR